MKDLPLPTLPIADLSSLLSADTRAARRSLHPSYLAHQRKLSLTQPRT